MEILPSLRYRNATWNDLPAIVAIYNQTIPSRMVTADTEPVTVEQRASWFHEHDPLCRPLWVVETEAGAFVGWVSFQDFYGRPAYRATAEISIYLDEQQRGKGYGRQVLAHCLQSAPQMGIRHIVGFIFAHNLPSLHLFRQAGFEPWGTLHDIAVLDGVERSLCIVGKRIGEMIRHAE